MRVLRILFIFLLYPLFASQTLQGLNEPSNSSEWFTRAATSMELRSVGATPFHLHITFHAYPGQQLLLVHGKPDFIAGDGVYDEIWINPHEWRREVSLSDYHAVEAEAGGARKMQSSSDYEPSRVYMLLDALLTPIPRTLTSREFHDRADWKGWKITPVTSGGLSLVRVSKETGTQRGDYADSYYFFPNSGALAMENRFGLVTIWSGDVLFENRIVPRNITIRCAERDLLTASVSIEHTDKTNAAAFELPGPSADPGMTLRPLHEFEIRVPDFGGSFGFGSSEAGHGPFFSFIGQIDRRGRYREVELLLAPSPTWAAPIMDHFRSTQLQSPTIDGEPCQFQKIWRVN